MMMLGNKHKVLYKHTSMKWHSSPQVHNCGKGWEDSEEGYGVNITNVTTVLKSKS